MYEIKNLIIQLSQWLYPWLGEISMAIMATLLVIFGGRLNRMIKRQIGGWHFILRTVIFILLCTFGYGAVLIYLTPMLTQLLASMGMIYLGPLVVGIFIALGSFAERNNHI
ncbi:DUF3392 domain-containing protein [sulfur-oxidizing endosymbiont of Gigantopelta aegis]|uniref:DUF3392 domain-containing protein n=1 Tax=sulfur-oxidizing endosymbiont of Gigantopelta aegis TaxID=2794934 RepID=UPI0018DB687E|nr:DUF3392 domain-containing protein [sulfur-oxidizing endosymbiont of Gigantopelta aegis]